MANEKMSLDALLSAQTKSTLYATVENVDGKADIVAITPWTKAAGCLCHLSIQVAKASIDAVSPTGDTHVCCGKTLRVVEVHFKKGEALPVEDVFMQLSAAASAHKDYDPSVFSPEIAPGAPPLQWNCGLACQNWLKQFISDWLKYHHPQSLYASPANGPLGPHARCLAEHDTCMQRCQYQSDPNCTCRCDQQLSRCMGHVVMPCP